VGRNVVNSCEKIARRGGSGDQGSKEVGSRRLDTYGKAQGEGLSSRWDRAASYQGRVRSQNSSWLRRAERGLPGNRRGRLRRG